MVRELIHDPIFLSIPAAPATAEDRDIARDLLDTLQFHRETCVGMAANMIGHSKAIIAFWDESGKKPGYTLLWNPRLLQGRQPYETAESCLSLLGGPRKCTRYQSIKVQYETEAGQTRLKTYSGWTAQIVQHELDHLQGILI